MELIGDMKGKVKWEDNKTNAAEFKSLSECKER